MWAISDEASGSTASELVSPPAPTPMKGRLILWILTLGSFLGGAYYGYLFQKSPVAGSTELTLVNDGKALVAHWNPRASAVASADKAQMLVTVGGRLVSTLFLDKTTLHQGQVVLAADGNEPVAVQLTGAGFASHARYVPGDPLETDGANVDPETLRRQIADQQQVNTQLERRLAAGSR